MKEHEIVQRTLEYNNPDRVSRSFRESDYIFSRYSPSDHSTDWYEIGRGRWERIDEWGNTWARLDPTSKGEVIKGVLDDIGKLDQYEFPDYSNPKNFERIRKIRSDNPDKWLIGELPGFSFGIARKLLKLDNYLIDLILKPALIHKLHNRIDNLLKNMIHNYAKTGVDSVMFWEDWGTQKELMINPDLWRKEFSSRFSKLCLIAHQLNIKVFMHSCGHTEEIVPDLIEAGIDVFQFDQPDLHGIDNLASHQEKTKVTFWCPVDIQKTLQTKDETAIRNKAREMLDKLWKGRGGFIAGFYKDNTSIGLDPRWQEYACEEFIHHGIRENYIQK